MSLAPVLGPVLTAFGLLFVVLGGVHGVVPAMASALGMSDRSDLLAMGLVLLATLLFSSSSALR